MKIYQRTVFATISLSLIFGSHIFPLGVRMGISSGIGSSYNWELGSIFSGAFIYNPYIGIEIDRGFSLNIGYEGGYEKVREYWDPGTLELSGFQLFAEYIFKQKKLTSFLKGGIVYYSIKNTFAAEELKVYDLSEKNLGFLLGFGLVLPLNKNISLKAEVNNLVLKMKPSTEWINIGGLRYVAGLIFRFDI